MNNIKNKIINFYNGIFFPVFIALFIFISHTFEIDKFAVFALVPIVCVGFLFLNNIRFLLSPVLMFVFICSEKTFSTGYLNTNFQLISSLILGLILVGFFIFFVVKNKLYTNFSSIKSSKLLCGFLALSVAFLLNGFFDFGEYKSGNIIFAIGLVGAICLVFVIFFIGLDYSKENVDYFIFVLYLTSILILFEALLMYIFDAVYVDGKLVKESIVLGWGMWNNLGGILTLLLPVHFYYASTKKHGYIFYGTAIISYIFIVLSLSRSSLLVASLLFAICAILSIIKGDNRKTNLIITVSLVLIGIVGAIIFRNKISNILNDYINRGFDDNGRFDMYKYGLNEFLSHPIFGSGFANGYKIDFGHGMPIYRYHNTIIQMLASCGAIGIVAYVFHRVQTIICFVKGRKTLSNIYLFLMILGLLLTSLLDNHFFNIYPTFFYSIALVFIEKSQKE